jgi:hypothetical protein
MRSRPWSIRGVTFCCIGGSLLAVNLTASGQDPGAGAVQLLKTPDSGIQPQAVADAKGTVHLIYFKGEPYAGDLYYVRRSAGSAAFTTPIRINSQPGSAIAAGTIRGGQIALGKGGRVHVAWNGSQRAKPSNPVGGSPMLYTRSDPDATRFEPQRNLMQRTTALDGGGTIAADVKGNVYVAWHGRGENAPEGEAWRAVWIARSTDEGATFAPEGRALDHPTGACACCGTRALVDRRGALTLLYRAATANVNRDMTLIQSTDNGAHFQVAAISPWRMSICPMSSESLVDTDKGVLAAWETNGQVFFSRIDPDTMSVSPIAPSGVASGRKHPALAASFTSDVILVWTEGTGWQKGGALAWQVFDSSGKPRGEQRRLEGGIPVWGLATVVARPEGGFVIVH